MAPKAFGADTSCDEGVAATTGDVLRPITASLRLRLAKRAEGPHNETTRHRKRKVSNRRTAWEIFGLQFGKEGIDGREFPLMSLPPGEIPLRDVRLAVGDKLCVTAEFGSVAQGTVEILDRAVATALGRRVSGNRPDPPSPRYGVAG